MGGPHVSKSDYFERVLEIRKDTMVKPLVQRTIQSPINSMSTSICIETTIILVVLEKVYDRLIVQNWLLIPTLEQGLKL